MKGTCASCDHSREMAQRLFCCRMPPQVVALPIQHPLTREVSIDAVARFPAVETTAWCGEFREKAPVLAS